MVGVGKGTAIKLPAEEGNHTRIQIHLSWRLSFLSKRWQQFLKENLGARFPLRKRQEKRHILRLKNTWPAARREARFLMCS